MTLDPKTAERLRARADAISQWLGEEAPYTGSDQRHLITNTPERAYWHYGYMVALLDVLRLMDTESTRSAGSGDTSD